MLAPHHAQLGLPGLPTTAAEFAGWDYPAPGEAGERADQPSHATLLKRLRDMQAALPSLPGRPGRRRARDRPRRAAPVRRLPDQRRARRARTRRYRRYLAVRDLRIECAFPHAAVEQLAVVDLPGLGEVAVGAEAHHVDGLQNEVDVVLLVKRAMGDEAYWGEADARTLDLLDIARGFVAKRDFVFLVLNQGGIDPALQRTLRDDVDREINMGEPDRFFQVLETDAADDDRRVRPGARPGAAPPHRADAGDGRRGAGRHPGRDRRPPPTGSSCWPPTSAGSWAPCGPAPAAPRRTCRPRARRLRQDLAAGLQELVARLHEQAREASEDPEFVAAVERVYAANREWITGGLGVGEQIWRDEGLRRMRVDGFSAGYTGEELNRIRVEISGSFEQIDGFFAERMRAAVERGRRGAARGALGDAAGPSGADRRRGATPCASWPSCSTGPLPRARGCAAPCRRCWASGWTTARSCTRGCAPSWTGWPWRCSIRSPARCAQQMTVPTSEAGVEQLYRFVVRTAEQAAYLTKKALLREAVTPALVLHAAAEQFEDTVIRSGDSEVEFRRLADSYKNEIWPGVYQEIDAANARFAAVTRARDALVASLARPAGEARHERTKASSSTRSGWWARPGSARPR